MCRCCARVLTCDTLPRTCLIAVTLAVAAGCSNSSREGFLHTFDPCAAAVAPETAAADELDAVSAGIALWNGAAKLQLALDGDAPPEWPRIPLRFQDAAGGFHGLYDDEHVIVFINRRLDPAYRPVVIAHELGHTFGLVHIAPEARTSLMNAGNLDVTPTAEDVAALFAIWGTCERRAVRTSRPAFPR